MKTLYQKSMRGIYYAYGLRLISLPGVWQSFCMLGIVILLSHFISPRNIFENILQLQVGSLARFLYEAFLGTEVWTWCLSALFVLCLFSIRTSLAAYYRPYSFAR